MSVFHHRNDRKRLWAVRTAFVLCVGIVLVSIWQFTHASDSLTGVCDTCTYSEYLTKPIPAKNIALTFDDGPTENTEKLLRFLTDTHVPATFFLVGQNVMRYPEVTKKIVNDGFVIGNHTFTHSPDAQSSQKILTSELDRTNKLIEAVTGYSARLYRPPYLQDMDNTNTVRPLFSENPVWSWAKNDGYVVVGRDIESFDWKASTPEEVLANVKVALTRKENDPRGSNYHVVLFHDRPETIAAMPQILAYLKTEGYNVVPLTTLLGMTREEAMPLSNQPVSDANFVANFVTFFAGFWKIVIVAIVVLTAFTLLRPLIFIAMKKFLRDNRVRSSTITDQQEVPAQYFVSVLVPSYNEEKNLRATVLSLLQNTRLPNEIIIIDDGSTDTTLEKANLLARMYPNIIRVIHQKNGGKWTALNTGLAAARGDIIFTLDGDTILDPVCIGRMLPNFKDPKVGAVSGKVVPAMVKTAFQKVQYLEYVVAQNLDKAALSRLGAVNVVPGAIGAWRRDAMEKVGGYNDTTLAEDQEITLAVLAAGYKVIYEPEAIAHTETPANFKGFFLQRLRWMYGTFECVYKFAPYMFSRKYPALGWVAVPYAFAVNVLFPLIVCIINIALIVTAILGLGLPSLLYIILFILFDAAYAFLAFADEEKKPLQYLLYIPLQRIVFMVLYAALTLLVTVKAFDGSPTKWNKLARTGGAEEEFMKRFGDQKQAQF